MKTKYNKEKFKQIVLYIINKINNKELGSVKLNKILWFADLEKYMDTDDTITGGKYAKQALGPVSKHLVSALKALEREQKITITQEFPNESMYLYEALENADTSEFKDDIKYLDKTIKKLRKLKAAEVSEMTHTAYWRALENGDEMLISMAETERMMNNDIDYNSIQWDRIDD